MSRLRICTEKYEYEIEVAMTEVALSIMDALMDADIEVIPAFDD